MRSRVQFFGVAVAALAALCMAAPAVRATDIPSALPSGKTTDTAYFAVFNRNGAYFDLQGMSNAQYAAANATFAEPRLGQAAANGKMLLLSFHGVTGQPDIISSVPGDTSGRYSPVMHILIMLWRSGVQPVLVTSFQDAVALNHAGFLLAFDTGVVLNGPVVWEGTDLNGSGGHLPSTLLQDVQVMALRPATATQFGQVDLKVYPTYFNGNVVYFRDLEHADGMILDAAGNPVQKTPVPRIGLQTIGKDAVSKLYGIEGQDPVVDSTPGMATHSPVWQIYFVRRKEGFTRVLTSEQEVLAARDAGNVTIEPAGDNAIFEGPLAPPSRVQVAP